VIAGMTAQGFNLEIREYPHGWRANFYPVGLVHSIVVGSAWASTPRRAEQNAAREALTRPRSLAMRPPVS
jgi:predicted MFS family arabinose efflux permease